ncbi:MAG: metallopeptidase TldD-related protein [Acidobacteriota bacterium]|nr:metallopeptidase TldD-related protein [Acidobacteriota bacterium]MDE2965392.1 metallopeptidase TldD-related protein [Acidobacteriota bacterium]
MKRGTFCTLLFSVLLPGHPLQAQENMLMKALRDEMGRTMERLQLEDMDRPYYVAYWVSESEGRGSTAILGGLLGRGRGTGSRNLSVELRVGDHDLDNTNFMDFGRLRSRVVREGFPVSLPLRDDYKELRRQIWLATDGAYKQAVQSLAKKRATLQNKTRVEIVPDFSREEPVEYRDETPPAPLPDRARLEVLVQELSALFKEMPDIFDSRVSAGLSRGKTYFVNSEGSSYTRNFSSASIQVLAATQAVDGTHLEDFVVARGRQWKDLPDRAELEQRIRAMAERLGRLREASFVERYNGPVLFEGQAAAELVSQILAPRLLALRPPMADEPMFGGFGSGSRNPFLEKLGSRVLPRSLSIIDDPTAGSHGEASLLGGYEVDDEGVRSRRTTVIQRGILKTLLATRTPVSGVSNSTGNRRNEGPKPSNLFLISRNGLKQEEIRQELLDLVEERGLDFGIVVRRVGSPEMTLSRDRDYMFAMPGEEQRPKLRPVTEAYKVFPDGREELIRKAVLLSISASSFREIAAASESLTPYHTNFRVPMTDPFSSFAFMGPPPLVSLVVPSLLFEDLALRRPPGDIPRPPLLAHPLSRQQAR